jgi:hypothetical protein
MRIAAPAAFSLALAAGLALAGCGSDSSSPTAPAPPLPTPSAPGPISGGYTFQVTPGAGCGLPGSPYQVAVDVVTLTGAHSEIRATLPGGDTTLGIDMLYITAAVLQGAIGTKRPVTVGSGVDVYLRDIGTGTVTGTADGRGEVLDGTMFGDVVVGDSTCTAEDHRWTLRPR